MPQSANSSTDLRSVRRLIIRGDGSFTAGPNGDWVSARHFDTALAEIERLEREREGWASVAATRNVNMTLIAEERDRLRLEVADLRQFHEWAAPQVSEDIPRMSAEIERLRDALQEIATYPPGELRPLADEIAIYKLATEALKRPAPDLGARPLTEEERAALNRAADASATVVDPGYESDVEACQHDLLKDGHTITFTHDLREGMENASVATCRVCRQKWRHPTRLSKP